MGNAKKKYSKNPKIFESIKLLLGDGIKKIQPNEYITINSQRRVCTQKEK